MGRTVGTIVGAIVGAVVGYFVGPQGGLQAGLAVGSLIGGVAGEAIDPTEVPGAYGARLSDLRTQTSTVGTPIPILFGTSRFAGNVIWSSGLLETTKEADDGGKGGAPTQSVTSYSYRASFAVGLCEGPIKGLRRIWADGKLIYDISDKTDFVAQAVSGIVDSVITVYTGSDTQLPDPTMESYVGVGNATAHRGLAYVVFTDYPLENYGNRIPNLEFEVVSDGTLDIDDASTRKNDVLYPWNPAHTPMNNKNDHTFQYGGSALRTNLEAAISDALIAGVSEHRLQAYLGWSRDGINLHTADEAIVPDELVTLYLHYNSLVLEQQSAYSDPQFRATLPNAANVCAAMFAAGIAKGETFWWSGVTDTLATLNAAGFYCLHDITPSGSYPAQTFSTSPELASAEGSTTTCTQYPASLYNDYWIEFDMNFNPGFYPSPKRYWASLVEAATYRLIVTYTVGGNPPTNIVLTVGANTGPGNGAQENWGVGFSLIDGGSVGRGGSLTIQRFYSSVFPYWGFSPDTLIKVVRTPRKPDNPCVPRGADLFLANDYDPRPTFFSAYPLLPDNPDYCVIGSLIEQNVDYTMVSGSFKALQAYTTAGAPSSVTKYPRNPVVVSGGPDDTQAFWEDAYDAAVLLDEIAPGLTYGVGYPVAKAYAWVQERTVKQLDPNQEFLSAIVSSVCIRSGLSAGQINVTELTDLVSGYLIARPMTARQAIEGLTAAYFFDAVESDAKIKFHKRGGASVATIPESHLSAGKVSETSGPLITISRVQQLELPTRVRVQYLDKENAYQVGQQYAERVNTDVESVLDIQLAIVLTGQQAIRIADRVLYDIWQSRTRYEISVPREFLKLDPTDVIDVEANGNTYPLRIGETEFFEGVIKVRGVSNEPTIYSSYLSAAPRTSADSILAPISPSIVSLYDLPALLDADDGPGFYVGVRGIPPFTWNSAVIQRSTDEQATWLSLFSTTRQAITGVCTDILAVGPQSLYDRINSVTVQLDRGELSSAASDLALLNGANVCAIGQDGAWEVLQFRDAVLNMDGTYTLSHLIRGRRGSEWAIPLHAADDLFVLLSTTNISRFSSATDRLNLEDDFRGITVGGASTGAAVQFTAQGEALECYAPTHVKALDSAAGILLSWQRRNRLDGEWKDLTETPMSESAESYEIDILNGTTVVRTLTATTRSVTYTLAQQGADFGGPQNVLSAKVYQLSGTVGRGNPATVTLAVIGSELYLTDDNGLVLNDQTFSPLTE